MSTHFLPAGYKKMTFKDGQKIVYNHSHENIYNLTYGIMGIQIMGRVDFKDEKNGIEAFVEFG